MAKDFYINDGATHVVIMDDYCCSREEVPKILERIGHQAYRDMCTAKVREQKEQTA